MATKEFAPAKAGEPETAVPGGDAAWRRWRRAWSQLPGRMLRISDARMSGTGCGTVVLHVAPEAAVGGPLALVRTGDWIELDVPARTLTLDVSDNDLPPRRAGWSPPPPAFSRGYAQLYVEHVQQPWPPAAGRG